MSRMKGLAWGLVDLATVENDLNQFCFKMTYFMSKEHKG